MEFLKNISIYDKSLLDCFDEKGYKNEIIGVYNPDNLKLFEFLKRYHDLGFKFLIYSKNKTVKDNNLNIKVEINFIKFYKQIDFFIINSLKDYPDLIENLAGMEEKIFVLEDSL